MRPTVHYTFIKLFQSVVFYDNKSKRIININNSCNNGEKTKLIIRSLLPDMITNVLLMGQQHLANLNRECLRRCRERKRQGNRNEYMRKVGEQKRKNRPVRRSNNFNNEKLL